MSQTSRRVRINAMMEVAEAMRNLLSRPHLPVHMMNLMIKIEDDAWKILRDDLGAYFEEKR